MSYKTTPIQSDLFTSERENTRRLKTEEPLTSFSENRQFGFFDSIDFDKQYGHQIVYRIRANKKHNLLLRRLDFYVGGITYLVYPFGTGETFTGTLIDVSDQIYDVNQNITIEGRTSLPETSHTIERAEGNNIFTTTAKPKLGASCLAGGSTQSSRGNFSESITKIGYPANLDIWVVLEIIPSVVADSKGFYELIWEDIE